MFHQNIRLHDVELSSFVGIIGHQINNWNNEFLNDKWFFWILSFLWNKLLDNFWCRFSEFIFWTKVRNNLSWAGRILKKIHFFIELKVGIFSWSKLQICGKKYSFTTKYISFVLNVVVCFIWLENGGMPKLTPRHINKYFLYQNVIFRPRNASKPKISIFPIR